jgi:signal transduction histidine kinase
MTTGAAIQARDGPPPAAVGGTPLPVSVAAAAALACLTTYAAALLGHAMVGDGASTTPAWSPSAILLAALLLSPPRAWPAYVVGALAGGVAAAVQHGEAGWSAITRAVPYAIACVIVAAVVRHLLGGPPRLGRPRDLVVYLVAAAGLGPLVAVSVGAGGPGRRLVAVLGVLLPLAVWAAVRVGPLGATGVMSAAALAAMLDAGWGAASAAVVFELPRLLLLMAVPALALAAVVGERRDADGALGDREAGPRGTAEPPPRSAQRLLQSTMDALSAHIAILDEHGTVIAVNEPWRRCAERIGLPLPTPGVRYAALCAGVQGPLALEGRRIASAIRDILDGTRTELRLDYRFDTPGGPRWFELRMARFSDDDGARVVLAHENITSLKQAEAALRDLTGRLLRLQDEERRRIARELHDGAGQNLVALSMNLARLARLVRADERTSAIVADSLGLVEQSVQEMRTLSYVLHPPTLDGVGLASAVRWYVDGFAKRSGIDVRLELPATTERLPQEVESALFRVIQESLINIHRHSGSGTATIRLHRESRAVRLEVMDQGAGFAAALPGDGQGSFGGGIPGMRERLHQLGGHLDIRSDARGTTVTAVAPLQVESDAADPAG